ncbi:DinB family protein [Tenacibaculum amylolyticum]|uniref:DinB family protein n=1 Tax=Tenacibaculum amylolyticum TaxID=104269 RepID=UPI003893EC66
MIKLDITPNEFDAYYARYIDKLSDNSTLLESFTEGLKNTIHFFNTIPEEKLHYRYQPEKWNSKEILQHLIDTERIFMYRCFRIARRDSTPLTGFDQNIYVAPSNATHKSLTALLSEFEFNRKNSIQLLNSFSKEDLEFIGNSNGGAMSARAAAFVIPGHDIWHQEIIQERYL